MTTFNKILKQFEKDHYDAIHFPVKQTKANLSQESELKFITDEAPESPQTHDN